MPREETGTEVFSPSHFPGTPMPSVPSFGIQSTVTFGTIIVPSCSSSLHVPGCSHYPGSSGWHIDSILNFSHSSQQPPPRHLQQFGLQVYGPQPGWLEPLEYWSKYDCFEMCHITKKKSHPSRTAIVTYTVYTSQNVSFYNSSSLHRAL